MGRLGAARTNLGTPPLPLRLNPLGDERCSASPALEPDRRRGWPATVET
jgi:hypothetical protein